MSNATQATASYSHDTIAPATTIWALFKAVSDWKNWNPGVHDCALEGPFATGSWFTMVLPDQDVIRSQLVEVTEPRRFTDETTLGDVVVRVTHQINPLPDGRNRITYEIDVTGENAQDICTGVSSDFPQVLQGLVAKAEGRA